MEENHNNHYIRADPEGRVIDYWSDGPNPEKDPQGATLLTSEGSYQFHFPGSTVENPPLQNSDGVYLYKYEDGEVKPRTQEEIEADTQAILRKQDTLYKIDLLKQKLLETDYQAIKFAEGWLSEEEFAPIRAHRQSLRDRINQLEAGDNISILRLGLSNTPQDVGEKEELEWPSLNSANS